MSKRRTKRAQGSGWSRAVAGSSVVHALVLAALWRGGARAPAAPIEASQVVVELKAEPAAWDPGAPAAALPDPPAPTVDEAKLARPLDAPEADRDNAVAKTVGPRDGEGKDRAAPAPDQGESGSRLPGLATRHDRSSLQSRVADADAGAQASRLRTSTRSSSPQAIRRELKTGAGDAVRTTDATRAPSAAAPEPPPGPPAPPDVAGPSAGGKVAALVEPPAVARASDRPEAQRGVGPLDAEAGARMFDVEARGRVADDQTRRAVSSEAHPGVTDFSHAGVVGETSSTQGRGPGEAPGAVARPTNGVAPDVNGARSPQELAAEAAERTRERVYERYRQQIQGRVKNALVFPKVLALRLEQGLVVVTFLVKPDGTLGDGPRVVKSSGFEEFDAEAVKAVLRAAPFPRRAENIGMSVSMPVEFENPVVR
jgi:TonB family protein